MPRSAKELDTEAKQIWAATVHIKDRRPKNYAEEGEDNEEPVEATASSNKQSRSSSSGTHWCFIIGLSLFICGFLTLRILSGKYLPFPQFARTF